MKVGDEGTLRLSYQQWDSNADDQDYAQVGGAVSGGTVSGFGTVDRHVIDRTAVISYENPFSGNDMLDLRISGSFSDTIVDQTNATGIPPAFVCPPSGTGTAAMFCDSQFSYQTWQLKVENTSRWSGDDWENFLTYGWQTSYQVRSADGVTGTGNPVVFPHHPEGSDFKTGVFVQNEFVWDERLTIIPGMRIDWRRLTPGDSTPLSREVEEWAFSPKIAAHYKFTDSFAVFGSIAHTERFPTLDEVYSWNVAPSYSLRKERANNFEAGFAVSAWDVLTPGDGLQFKATGFYNDIKDLIVSCNVTPSPCGAGYSEHYQNIQSARIYGAELELAYDSDYVFASAAYTHILGKNRSTGQPLSSVAPHELALTLGGRLPEHGLSFGWKARLVAAPANPAWRSSEAAWTGSSRRFADSFDVHDIFVTWKPEEGELAGWEAQFAVENVFNRQYKEFLHNDSARGRTFKVSLAKQFGW